MIPPVPEADQAWAEHGWGLSAPQAALAVTAIALAGLLLRLAGGG